RPPRTRRPPAQSRWPPPSPRTCLCAAALEALAPKRPRGRRAGRRRTVSCLSSSRQLDLQRRVSQPIEVWSAPIFEHAQVDAVHGGARVAAPDVRRVAVVQRTVPDRVGDHTAPAGQAYAELRAARLTFDQEERGLACIDVGSVLRRELAVARHGALVEPFRRFGDPLPDVVIFGVHLILLSASTSRTSAGRRAAAAS